MTFTRDIQPALGHLEAALEASCATLICLESGRIRARELEPEAWTLQEQIGEAIRSVREAISELRAMHDVEASVLAFGFVLRTSSRPALRDGRPRQFRPRRTA